jgi:hypothetical protein
MVLQFSLDPQTGVVRAPVTIFNGGKHRKSRKATRKHRKSRKASRKQRKTRKH